MPKLARALLLLVLATAPPLAAGTVITLETRDLGDQSVETTTMSLEGSLAAVASDAESSRMIFRGDDQQMVLVDDETKTYTVFDQALMQGLAGQMDAAMAQMEAALKDLPPEQQEMARRMMRQPAPAQTAPAATVQEIKKTSQTGTREGYSCVKYEVLESGTKVRELWVTDWSNVRGQADLSRYLRNLSAFTEKLVSAFSRFGASATTVASSFAQWHRIDGLPIVTIEYEQGAAVEESTLRSITSAAIDPRATFEPPADYTRRTLDGL